MRSIERITLYLSVCFCVFMTLDYVRAEDGGGTQHAPLTTSSLTIVNATGARVMELTQAPGGGGQITVYNKGGKVTCRVRARADNDGEITLMDEHGSLRANLGGNDDGGYCNIWNQKGDPAAYLGADGSADAGYLAVYGPNRKKGVELYAVANGGGVSTRCFTTDTRVASLEAAGATGSGALALATEHGKTGFLAFSSPHGGQCLLMNSGGQKVAFLGVSAKPAGNGLLYLADTEGKRLVESGRTSGAGGYLNIRNGRGKRILFLGTSTGREADDGVVEVSRRDGGLGVVLRAHDGGSAATVYDQGGRVIRSLR